MRRANRRGFTLIEAVVSLALVAIGVVGAMRALGGLTQSDRELRDRERMQRLAIQKYDELLGTGALSNASQSGDFQDRNVANYTWKAEVIPSGVDNLDQIRVTVTDPDDVKQRTAEVDGLRYTPPATTATPGTGAGG